MGTSTRNVLRSVHRLGSKLPQDFRKEGGHLGSKEGTGGGRGSFVGMSSTGGTALLRNLSGSKEKADGGNQRGSVVGMQDAEAKVGNNIGGTALLRALRGSTHDASL